MMNIKFWKILILVALLGVAACDKDDTTTPPPPTGGSGELVINEFLAKAETFSLDDDGTYPDWIELYNPGTEDINIGGWYLWDDLAAPMADWYQMPAGTAETVVPSRGWLVLYADKNEAEGILHIGVKLSQGGEDILLADASGEIVYSLTFEAQTPDISMGLTPDGTGDFGFLASPTPRVANSGSAGNMSPVIDNVELDPVSQLPDAPVTVNVAVYDDSGIASVDLLWNIDGGDWTTVAMTASSKVTGDYTGVIPGQAQGVEVGYYILVTDSEAATTTEPADAPTEILTYMPLLAIESDLYINEFMASNDSYFACPGEYEIASKAYVDWIEIYNAGDTAIDIGGMYITDDLSSTQEWQIPTTHPDSTTIDAGGFLVLFADKDTDRGVLHVNIKLSGNGESIGLYGDDGEGHIALFDSYTYASAAPDTSEGRTVDGGAPWAIFSAPTIGASNEGAK